MAQGAQVHVGNVAKFFIGALQCVPEHLPQPRGIGSHLRRPVAVGNAVGDFLQTLHHQAAGKIDVHGIVKVHRDVGQTEQRYRTDIPHAGQARHAGLDRKGEQLLHILGRQPWREASVFGDYAGGHVIARAMECMGVDALADRRADTLSGGERARVLIARALAQAAPLLVADEPVAGLDPAHQIALMEVFGSLLHDGRSVVCSLHDLGLAARWCTRLVMLSEGRVVADGPPSAVLTPENLRRVYGVEAFFGHAGGGPVVMPTGLSKK